MDEYGWMEEPLRHVRWQARVQLVNLTKPYWLLIVDAELGPGTRELKWREEIYKKF